MAASYDNIDSVFKDGAVVAAKLGAHTHAQSDVTNLVSDLAGKAASTHSHAQGDVTGLTTALGGLWPTGFKHKKTTGTTNPGDGNGTDRWYPGGAVGTTAFSATTQCYAYPWWCPDTVSINQLGVNVNTGGAAGSQCKLAIWADNGNFWPGSLVIDGGGTTHDCSTATDKLTTVSGTLTAGTLYWIGLLTGTTFSGVTFSTVPSSRITGMFIPSTGLTNSFEGVRASNSSSFTLGSFPTQTGVNSTSAAPFVKYRVA